MRRPRMAEGGVGEDGADRARGSRAALESPAIEANSSASHTIAVTSAMRLAASARRRTAGESARLSRSGA